MNFGGMSWMDRFSTDWGPWLLWLLHWEELFVLHISSFARESWKMGETPGTWHVLWRFGMNVMSRGGIAVGQLDNDVLAV